MSKKIGKSKKKLDMDQLLGQVLKMFTTHNVNDITYSSIARTTQVPRSTLYYYFGNNLLDLLDEAVKLGTKVFVDLYQFEDEIRASDWDTFQQKRFLRALKIVRKYTWGPELFLSMRNDKSRLGNVIRELEQNYCRHMVRAWQQLTRNRIDYKSIRFVSYMKMGVLLGVTTDQDLWNDWSDKELLKSSLVQNFLTALKDILLKSSE